MSLKRNSPLEPGVEPELELESRPSRVPDFVANGPLCARKLRALRQLENAGYTEQVVDVTTNLVANLMVHNPSGPPLRFREVSTEAQWAAVRAMRKRVYADALPYLMGALGDRGEDPYDRHSFVFAAWAGEKVVATIRATLYPFETLEHLDPAALGSFLGADWASSYIEWGRLLVDQRAGYKRLMPALVMYAGLWLLSLTPYRKYFGYTRSRVRSLLTRFQLAEESLEFEIPARGAHKYQLLKGDLGLSAARGFGSWVKVSGSAIRAEPVAALMESWGQQ